MQEQNFFQRHKVLVVVGAIVIILALWTISMYNSFVTQSAQIGIKWAQVENNLQRRFDLIQNLVNTVKGTTQQEKDIIGTITEARTRYSGATTPDEKAKAAGQVESSFGRLLAITENYPQLQSIQAFRDLMISLEGTENRLAVERKTYNDTVGAYNISIARFPGSIFARIFGFTAHEQFKVADEAKANPQVNFSE